MILSSWASLIQCTGNPYGNCFAEGIRDPYVYGYHLGVQHEFKAQVRLEVNYLELPDISCSGPRTSIATRIGVAVGATITQLWQNLEWQWGLRQQYLRQFAQLAQCGEFELQLLQFRSNSKPATVVVHVDYTYSHSIDGVDLAQRGDHANGAAAGEGYTTDRRCRD